MFKIFLNSILLTCGQCIFVTYIETWHPITLFSEFPDLSLTAFSSAANAADQRGARQLYHPIQLLYPQRQPVQLTHPLFGGIQGIRTSSGQSPIRTGEQQNQEEILEIPPKEEVQEVQEEPKEEEKTEIFTTPCTMNDGRLVVLIIFLVQYIQ